MPPCSVRHCSQVAPGVPSDVLGGAGQVLASHQATNMNGRTPDFRQQKCNNFGLRQDNRILSTDLVSGDLCAYAHDQNMNIK